MDNDIKDQIVQPCPTPKEIKEAMITLLGLMNYLASKNSVNLLNDVGLLGTAYAVLHKNLEIFLKENSNSFEELETDIKKKNS